MTQLRKFLCASVAAAACLGAGAAPSTAIVGGTDAGPNEYPAVAEITFGGFGCTGTLISPRWVLSAGHCGSLTGGAGVASPAAWPAPLITVRVGSNKSGQGERVSVSRVVLNPNYLLGSGYDISLLNLSAASTKAPVKVAGAGAGAIWAAGTLAEIVGWGVTEEGGSSPSTLQKAKVPITTDAYCADAYSDFDARTMVCAGYPEGGVDTCQGDSGGPLFGRTSTGALKVVGATSFGEGCARPGKPGVYARVADTVLREWIRSQAPDAVD